MGKRGKQPASAGILSVVPPLPEPAPSPPDTLSEGAKLVWIELFDLQGVKPAQLTGGLHLLECFCVAVHLARRYAHEAEAAESRKVRDEAGRAFRATAATANMLGRSLRLNPRTRLDRRISLKTVPAGRKPWEWPRDDDAS
jgi:hypothetical protein